MVTVWVGWRKGLLYYPLVPDSLTSDDHTHTCTHTHIQHTVTRTHSVVLCVCFRATCLSLSACLMGDEVGLRTICSVT